MASKPRRAIDLHATFGKEMKGGVPASVLWSIKRLVVVKWSVPACVLLRDLLIEAMKKQGIADVIVNWHSGKWRVWETEMVRNKILRELERETQASAVALGIVSRALKNVVEGGLVT